MDIVKELNEKIDKLTEAIIKNGGKGSGNFGHAGRPGEIGGSSSDGSSKAQKKPKTFEEYEDAYYKMYDKVGLDTLFDDLYDTGDADLDDVRYSLQVITGHYSAMIHGETVDEKVNKEYRKEIKESIEDARKSLKKVKGHEYLKKQVEEVISYIEDNPYEA